MEIEEYRRMAAMEDAHWWYRSTRALLGDVLGPALPAGGLFLDAGAGTGATGAWMAQRGRVVASDFEPLALELYDELHREAVGLTAADVQQLPFASGSFDAVLCVTVLCHRSIAVPEHAVGELARVVKPGGVLCLWEPGVERLRRAHDRETHSARRFSLATMQRMLAANGLTVERATGAYSFLVPAAAAKAVVERGDAASDLDRHAGGLGGVLSTLARAERAVLRRRSLPFGLSVVAIGRKPLR